MKLSICLERTDSTFTGEEHDLAIYTMVGRNLKNR